MIAAFDAVLDRFRAPITGETDRQRVLREGAGGLALHWWLVLPEGKPREKAISALADAMELACSAVDG